MILEFGLRIAEIEKDQRLGARIRGSKFEQDEHPTSNIQVSEDSDVERRMKKQL